MHFLHTAAVNPRAAKRPVLLFRDKSHSVHWLGVNDASAFRCNTYLVGHEECFLLIDPGAAHTFTTIQDRVAELTDPAQLRALILSHQDPDVAASLPHWLALNPDLQIISSPRTHVLLTSYHNQGYIAYDIEDQPVYELPGHGRLRFVPCPFLHAPGAFTTHDSVSGFLFSGDVWGALELTDDLVVRDFSAHQARMDLFNKDYMACNRAALGFTDRLTDLAITAILPQHGSIIPDEFVEQALAYLASLACGLDLLYPLSTGEKIDPEISEGSREPKERDRVTDSSDRENGDEGTEVTAPEPNLAEALRQAMRLSRMRDQALLELKTSQERLARSEAMLAEAQAIAHLGSWIWDIKSGALEWSDEIYKIFGTEPGSFTPTYETFLRSVHPDDRVQVKLAVRRALNEDIPYEIIHRIIRPDGQIRTVQERGRLSRGPKSEPVRMVGTVQDITTLAGIEEELTARNQLIEAIQTMQAVFIATGDLTASCAKLLKSLTDLSMSQYGFIGEVRKDPDQRPYLIVYAMSDLSWDATSTDLYAQTRKRGMEFHNLDNLFGRVITTGQQVLANDAPTHPASRGAPEGHPAIRSFLGLPVYYGEDLVGEIGLANRPGGYPNEMTDFLQPVITAYAQILVAAREQQARRRAEEILAKEAKLDGLLGIPNRRALEEYLARQIASSDRSRKPLSLIMIDVDHFKLYNDRYGHQQGDRCLKDVATAITSALERPLDLAARYGGEEFCCVLPETDRRGAHRVALRITEAMHRADIPHTASPVLSRVTLSLGVATRKPASGLSAENLLSLADHCLYEAKARGRNRIVFDSQED